MQVRKLLNVLKKELVELQVRNNKLVWLMAGMALISMLAALSFWGISIFGLEAKTAGLFTIFAAVAIIIEIGINKVLAGKVREPITIVALVVAGIALLAGILSIAGVQLLILDTMAGLINLLIAMFLLIEIWR